jgi:hypothetical protein
MPYAKDMDNVLHRERAEPRRMPWRALPDGAFVDTDNGPVVIAGDHLAVFDEDAYAYRQLAAKPVEGFASVLTPPSTVAVLSAGYPVQIDHGAR